MTKRLPIRLAACSAMLLSAAACGLKGPLYVPDSETRPTPAGEAAAGEREKHDPRRRIPAPQSQKKDREAINESTRDESAGDEAGGEESGSDEARREDIPGTNDVPGNTDAPLTPPGGDRSADPPLQGAHGGARG